MKKEKIAKAFKTYNLIMNEIWKLITILLIGILIGWFIKRKNGSNLGFVISISIALVVGLASFFVGIIRVSKNKEKEDLKEKEEPVKLDEEGKDDESPKNE